MIFFSHKLEFESSQITICRSPKKNAPCEDWEDDGVDGWQFYIAFPQPAHDGYTKIRFVIYRCCVFMFRFPLSSGRRKLFCRNSFRRIFKTRCGACSSATGAVSVGDRGRVSLRVKDLRIKIETC